MKSIIAVTAVALLCGAAVAQQQHGRGGPNTGGVQAQRGGNGGIVPPSVVPGRGGFDRPGFGGWQGPGGGGGWGPPRGPGWGGGGGFGRPGWWRPGWGEWRQEFYNIHCFIYGRPVQIDNPVQCTLAGGNWQAF
jgi:hypothetical protein